MAHTLYIHWPFCLKKCPYCDFNSHVRDSVDHSHWQKAMLADMRFEAEQVDGAPLTSIFFGGGTPSLMPPSLVAALLDEAQNLWGFSPDIEITLEANPSSVESANFAGLAMAGVNRLSLGVQALDDAALQFLGRLHDVSSALTALEIAQNHFARVSFDLIYARPHQTPDQWLAELTRALSFGTSHLSLYQLTIEPGPKFETMVRQKQFIPLDDDAAGDLFALTRAHTAAAGLPAYEISNHAQLGQESRHNLTYWRYQDYCGIGPGAHGRRGGMATIRHKKPENWLESVAKNGHGISEIRPLAISEQASESLLMGLRLAEGINLSALSTRFALPENSLINPAKRNFYIDQGLLTQKTNRLIVTEMGMPLLDGLLNELIPAELVSPSPLPLTGGAAPTSPLPFRGGVGGGVSQTDTIPSI